MSQSSHNLKNPAVKRILQEVKEFKTETTGDVVSEPLEDNIFEWQFAIRGAVGTEFEGGIYHGRILLPPEYPFKPPAFIMQSANGRFEVGVKLCLSISQHHPEQWQPSWSVRTALVALIAFMPSSPEGALGGLDYPKQERRQLAARSRLQPPKVENPVRQKLIMELHERLLHDSPPTASVSAPDLSPPPPPNPSAADPPPGPPAASSPSVPHAASACDVHHPTTPNTPPSTHHTPPTVPPSVNSNSNSNSESSLVVPQNDIPGIVSAADETIATTPTTAATAATAIIAAATDRGLIPGPGASGSETAGGGVGGGGNVEEKNSSFPGGSSSSSSMMGVAEKKCLNPSGEGCTSAAGGQNVSALSQDASAPNGGDPSSSSLPSTSPDSTLTPTPSHSLPPTPPPSAASSMVDLSNQPVHVPATQAGPIPQTPSIPGQNKAGDSDHAIQESRKNDRESTDCASGKSQIVDKDVAESFSGADENQISESTPRLTEEAASASVSPLLEENGTNPSEFSPGEGGNNAPQVQAVSRQSTEDQLINFLVVFISGLIVALVTRKLLIALGYL